MSTETNHKMLPASLPSRFADIKQESLALRQLAGLLDLIKLNEECLATIESNYSAAIQWGGMYENVDLGCLCFDSGLFTASGKRIYIGIRQRDEFWHLDCAIRRDKEALESLGQLLRPNDGTDSGDDSATDAAPAPFTNQEPTPEESPADAPEEAAPSADADPGDPGDGIPFDDEPPTNTVPASLEHASDLFLQKEEGAGKGIPADDCPQGEDTPVQNSNSDANSSADEEELSPDSVETPVENGQNPDNPPEAVVLKEDNSTDSVDFDAPPTSWSQVLLPRYPTQEFLALALGYEDKILPRADFQQIFKDYTTAFDATKNGDTENGIRRVVGKPQFSFLLSRTTPQGEPLVLTFVPNKPREGDKNPRPWFCNRLTKFWPPKHTVPVAGYGEAEKPEVPVPAEPPRQEEDAPAQPVHLLDSVQAQLIYDTLVPPYRPGETVLLSKLGQQLSTHGIKCHDFGYNSFLQMLSDLPDLFTITSITPDSGTALIYQATILPWAEEDSAPKAEEQSKDNAPADSTDSADSSTPPFSMTDRQIEFSVTQRDMLSRLVNGEGVFDTTAVPLTAEQVIEVRNSYDAAVAEGKLSYDSEYDCYSFPLTLLAQDGSAISANIRRGNNPKKAPWFVCYIRKERAQGVRPKDRLTNFAFLGDFQDFLQSLADHAEAEQWSFSGENGDFSILWNYIRYTFYRLEFENKIVIDEENGYAAFDTGLLSRRFGDPLFAVFEPNHNSKGKQKWKFNCFCSTFQEGTPAERNTAAKLTVKPQMPSYFTNIYDTIFDPDSEMQVNYEHIFRDNLERFPLRWVHAQCDSWPRTHSIMMQIDAVEAKITEEKKVNGTDSPLLNSLLLQRKTLFKQLGAAVNDTADDDMQTLFDNMIYNLRGCIEKTLMRSRRNHQLAEPCFFPTRNVMSMLLPIRLFRSDSPDLALVLERQKSTIYIGRTVITMAMAYKNARLIRRFSSDWLNNYSIQDDDTDED